jgi:hypothetical protein
MCGMSRVVMAVVCDTAGSHANITLEVCVKR